MEEYDKQYPQGEEGMYDDMYYYDDGKGFPGGPEGGHPGQMMQGGVEDDEEFDSDDALFFDNNDLANRIWEDGDWTPLFVMLSDILIAFIINVKLIDQSQTSSNCSLTSV